MTYRAMVSMLSGAFAALGLLWPTQAFPGETTDAATSPTCTFCPEPVPDAYLKVEANPLLVVDANGAASGVVRVCNREKAPVPLDLSLTDFFAFARDGSGYPLASSATLSIAGQPAAETKRLAADECVDVRIDVASLWQAGLLTAEMRSAGAKVAVIKAVRYQVPFNLKVDGSTPEKVDVSFTRGKTSRIWLRNEDPMAYRFRWRIEIGDFVKTGDAWVEPKRRVELPVELDRAHFSFFESGFLRTGAKSGSLLVDYEPDPSFRVFPLPQKPFPLDARLNYWSEPAQRIANYLLILFALVFGIVISLLVNYALPTQGKRVAAKQRLADLEGRLAGLAGVVDSRTLSLLRVEKKRLRDELRELWPVFPSTDPALPRLDERIGWLAKRIELTAAAGAHLAAIERDDELSPDEEDGVRKCCDAVLRMVQKPSHTQKEVEGAEEQLRFAEQIRESAAQDPSPETIQSLDTMRQEALQGLELTDVDAQLWQPYEALRADLRKALQPPLDPSAARAGYIRLARSVRKAKLLRRFVELVDAFSDSAIRDARQCRGKDLLKALLPGPDESLQQADEIVRETEQNIGRTDVEKAVEEGTARLEIDPPRPFPYQLVTIRIHAKRPGIDTAVARRDVRCVWKINGETLEADDWTVGHYFEREATSSQLRKWVRTRILRRSIEPPRTFVVEATVKLASGDRVLEPLEVTVEDVKSYVESRTFLAIGALLITVFVVGIGLLAGAVEKLQTLDWISGLVAIVLLGFGADVLKRLITR